jgi:hypothetical protein
MRAIIKIKGKIKINNIAIIKENNFVILIRLLVMPLK